MYFHSFLRPSVRPSVFLSVCLSVSRVSVEPPVIYLLIFHFFNSYLTATQVSWNITVNSITSSSASVRWQDFPLSESVTHYLVRFKEPHGVSTLFRASSYSETYYTNRLNAYTSYDVQVLAFTTNSDGNVTYSSQTVTIKTAEGGKLPQPSFTTTHWAFIQILLKRTNQIGKSRYLKSQPKTIDLSMKFWGIITAFVGFIPPGPLAEV